MEIWLYEQTATRFVGKIKGFDEFMNIVLEEAEEVNVKTKKREALGTHLSLFYESGMYMLTFSFLAGMILLKGDNITLISAVQST